MKAINSEPIRPRPQILHYTGYDAETGGIVAIIRALQGSDRFTSIMGVNDGFQRAEGSAIPIAEFPAIEGEKLGLATLWRASKVADRVAQWLHADASRVFHGHSRAGLAVALHLALRGERRIVASVHCYGRHRWFYRWAAGILGRRLFWLSPAMRSYYGVKGSGWDQCVPGCVQLAGVPKGKSAKPRSTVVRFGGVGTIVGWKRWDLILKALSLIDPAIRERIHFSHIGTDDGSRASVAYADSLRKETIDLELTRNVSWLGRQPTSEQLLDDIDCLLVTSEKEPFSIAMLEALAAGDPVLAADDGGASDVVAEGRTGWFFQSGSAESLASQVARIVEGNLISGVRIVAEDTNAYSVEEIAGKWKAVYDGILAVK